VPDTTAPASIRVTRPYASEEELLENELDTFTRTSITLLGAQPRPPGLVLRFELLLSSGSVLVRGEGRAVGYKRDAYYGQGGLVLRFTRLDSRSKAFIDKAAAIRERRRPSSKAPAAESPSSPSSPSLPPLPLPARFDEGQAAAVALPAPSVAPSAGAPAPSAPSSVPPDRPSELDVTFVSLSAGTMPTASLAQARARSDSPPAAVARSTPRDRDTLLDRLRERSKALSADAVQKILERGRRA
jgi:hypothetical protein